MMLKPKLATEFLILLISVLLPIIVYSQPNQVVNKHIIVVYDFSGSVLKQTDNVRRANAYLTQLISQGPIQEEEVQRFNDHLLNNLDIMGFKEPLLGSGDILTFLSFGINREDISSAANTPQGNLNFVHRLSKNLIHTHGNFPNDSEISIEDFLNRRLPTTNSSHYNYTVSRYVLPILLNVIPEIYAHHMLCIIISDYRYGDTLPSFGDIEVFQRYAPLYVNDMNQVERSFQQLFITQDLLTLHIGGVKGIVIKVMDLSGRGIPRINFDETQQILLSQENKEEFNLPQINFKIRNISDIFEIKEKFFQITFPVSGKSRSYGVNIIGGNLYLGNIVTESINIPASIVPELGNTAKVKLCLKGIYNYKSKYGTKFSIFIESEERVINIERLSGDIPLAYKVIGLIAILMILGGSFIYIFVPSPGIGCEMESNPERREKINGKMCDIYEWTPHTSKIYIRIKIRNTQRKFIRKNLKTTIFYNDKWLTNHFHNLDAKITYLYKDYCQGQQIRIKDLKPGESDYAAISLDLSGTQEPPYKNSKEPMSIDFSIESNDKRIKSIHVPYNFIITPQMGKFWIGIDPGTTNSAIAGGDSPDNIEPVKLGERENIILSAICIRESIGEEVELNKQFGNGVECGEKAKLRIPMSPERVFLSAKKLLGYGNTRKIKINGKEKEFKGADAVSILSDYLVKQARQYFEEKISGEAPKINKAVVAVPNTFTPNKINQMKECIQNCEGIEEVLHVYEAEAVVLYYVSDYSNLNVGRKIPVGDIEYIMVFDFGGGTINVSIISVRQRGSKKEINVLYRIGYGIGGDNIDWIVAHLIWDKLGQYYGELSSPFLNEKDLNIQDLEDWRLLKYNLKHTAEEQFKIPLSEKYNREKASDPDPGKISITEDLQLLKNKTPINVNISLKDVINSKKLDILKLVKEAAQEVYSLFKKEKPFINIDTLIFAGKSSLFYKIHETILEVIEERDNVFIPPMENVKLAVSLGAAFYGVEKDHIDLTRNKTFLHYGLLRFNSLDKRDVDFSTIIPLHTYYFEDAAVREVHDINVQYNNDLFRFYQVAGNDPNEVMRKGIKYKMTEIAKVMHHTQKAESIKMKVDTKDNLWIKIKSANGEAEHKGFFEIKDIYEDVEESSAWF